MKHFSLFLACAASALSAGCTGPQLTSPKPLPPAPVAWSSSDAVQSDTLLLDWWRALGDRQLDDLVEQALANNTELAAATHNWEATQALIGEARAARLPIGTLDASFQRSRTAGAALQLDSFGGPRVLPSQTLVDAGVTLGWEIDLFGRLANMTAQARADAQTMLWARRGTEAAIAAAVVRAWSDLADANQQIELLDAREPLLADVASRLERAFAAGGVRRDTVEEARLSLAEAQQQRPQLEAARRNALRRLSTLTGRPAPDGLKAMTMLKPGALPVPAYVKAGRPEDLLRLRPDVAAAEQALLKSMARIKVARADLYPRISLMGSIGVTAAPGDIGDEGALRFGIGPSISWGLFDMTRIRARISAAGAQAQAAGAQWETAFLRAIEETDAALDTLAAARKAGSRAAEAEASAMRLARLSQTRQRFGQDDIVTATLARAQALRAEADSARATATIRSTWINVQVALGSGWRDGNL